MSNNFRRITTAMMLLGAVAFFTGCTRDLATEPATRPTEAGIFGDAFASGVEFQAFLGSKYDALDIDETEAFSGTACLDIIVPDSGDVSGTYAGGAFTTGIGRNLSGYNAVTFYAKASQDAMLNAVGLGNDNTGTSKFTVEVSNLSLTTTWARFCIPIPLAAKLTDEKGLFYFSDGREGQAGYRFWLDEITFEKVDYIADPQPLIPTKDVVVEVGDTINIGNGTVTYTVSGSPLSVSASERYFTFVSSDSTVARVNAAGVIIATGEGSAIVTAKLGDVDATGAVTVTVQAASAVPTTPAPTPTADAANVVALYSGHYTSGTIDTWSADWDQADVSDFAVGLDSMKKYSNLAYAGIDFSSHTLDISTMTYFHIDVWTPKPTDAPATFKIKLVDFGPDGVYSGPGGDDAEHEVTFDEATMNTGVWVSIDVPLSAFSKLTTKAHLAQMIISGSLTTVYVDNIYFHKGDVVTTPETAAPTPTVNPADVVSLFSDAYTNVPVDTWSASWDSADVEEYAIGLNATKKYTNLLFAGIEFKNPTVDASTMTHIHMDLWTPDWITAGSTFKVKLVDFGADGAYGGNDDVEHEFTFDHNSLRTGSWFSIDTALSKFTRLTTKGHLAQLIISGDPSTIYLDNVYFYNAHLPTAPTTSAPVPSVDPGNVISLFSDAYTNAGVDTWSTVWDVANVTDYLIGADHLKKYTNFLFAAIEFRTATVDATDMTYFHIDVWTPDPTDAPAVFRIKLVDFGPNGIYGDADDANDEITFDQATMETRQWVSIELPLANFTDLTTRGHLGQLIISGDPDTLYVDNVYFHK